MGESEFINRGCNKTLGELKEGPAQDACHVRRGCNKTLGELKVSSVRWCMWAG